MSKPTGIADDLRIWRHGPRIAATGAALFALAPLAAFANKGIVFAFLVAALSAHRRPVLGALWRRHRIATLGCALLCAWGLATLSFAPEPDPLRAATRLALAPLGLVLVVSLAMLDDAPREALARCLVTTVWATIALFAFQIATGGLLLRLWHALPMEEGATLPFLPPNIVERAEPRIDGRAVSEAIAVGNVLLAGMVWPAVGRLWRHGQRWMAAAMAATAFACVFALPHNAVIAGMLAGGTCFALALRWPRAVPVAVIAGLIGYALAAPALSTHWFTIDAARALWPSPPRTWEHRVGMWSYASAEISSVGLLGAGYDASRTLGDRGDVIADFAPAASPYVAKMEAIRLHPHNSVLQIRLELGAPGTAALILILAGIGAAFLRARAPAVSRAGAAGALAAMSVPFLVSFGIWQGWWLATLALVAGGAVLAAGAQRPAAGD